MDIILRMAGTNWLQANAGSMENKKGTTKFNFVMPAVLQFNSSISAVAAR